MRWYALDHELFLYYHSSFHLSGISWSSSHLFITFCSRLFIVSFCKLEPGQFQLFYSWSLSGFCIFWWTFWGFAGIVFSWWTSLTHLDLHPYVLELLQRIFLHHLKEEFFYLLEWPSMVYQTICHCWAHQSILASWQCDFERPNFVALSDLFRFFQPNDGWSFASPFMHELMMKPNTCPRNIWAINCPVTFGPLNLWRLCINMAKIDLVCKTDLMCMQNPHICYAQPKELTQPSVVVPQKTENRIW